VAKAVNPLMPEPELLGTDYYGIPAIHKPHWKWLIISYFFLGGISSASYAIAAIAGLSKREESQAISRVGHYVSFAAVLPCPALLILDLGRPERFLNMLKVFKPRSPMSLGTWGLMTFSFFSGTSGFLQAAEDGVFGQEGAEIARRLPASGIGIVGTAPAFFLGGYTGVLLGATAVPIWAKSANLLGPLFLSSAISSASSAIALGLVASGADDTVLLRIEEIKLLAIVAETCLLKGVSARLDETAKPLREGHLGAIVTYGVIGGGIVADLALRLVNKRRQSRKLNVAASVLGLAGGFALRYAVVMGGHASADDPQATFHFAR
jgi:formate-dependent nitrite reductase membrane component NrfD